MAPKKSKKSSAEKSNTTGVTINTNWEAGLSKAEFDEESWQSCVSLVAGRSPEEEELIQALALAIQKPQRKLFTLITWDSIVAQVHELGNLKTKKKDLPMFFEVTEPAKVLLNAGKEIPCELMANLLKFQLLQIKASDQQRRDSQQVSVSLHATDKTQKGPRSPEVSSKEKKTKLKHRGDIEPPVFKDDEPDPGPQQYILLLGFYQPHLIGLLDVIGVHVANVIKLCSERIKSSERQQEQRSGGNEQSLRSSSILDAVKALKTNARKLDSFWSGLRPVLDSGPPNSKLHDVVLLSYTVTDHPYPLHTLNSKTMLELGSQIFDGVANLMYDCLNWRRQHQHYRDNIRLINVPTIVQPSELVPVSPSTTPCSKKSSAHQKESAAAQKRQPTHVTTDVEMSHYNNLLDHVPPEACSVPVILNCMLEQVVISTEQSLPTVPDTVEEPKPQSSPYLEPELVSYILQRLVPHTETEEERTYLIDELLPLLKDEQDKKEYVEPEGGLSNIRASHLCTLLAQLVRWVKEERRVKEEQRFALLNPQIEEERCEGGLDKDLPALKLLAATLLPFPRNMEVLSMDDPLPSAVLRIPDYLVPELVETLQAVQTPKKSDHQPLVIRHHDDRTLRFRDVGVVQGFNPAEVELAMMRLSPLWDLIHSVTEQKHGNHCWKATKQQLQHYCTDDPTFLTKDPATAEDLAGRVAIQLDLSDIQSYRLRSLCDWCYTEHHDAIIFPQVLQSASEDYCCMDTFRGSHNRMYIFCHNPVSPYRQAKDSWDVTLHTDVKFRKYIEHVADIVSDWTREEELKREEMQIRSLSPAEPPEVLDEKTQEEDTMKPYIRKDSLKAWKLEQERLKEEEMLKKSKTENAPKAKQQQKEDRSPDKEAKTLSDGKKSRLDTGDSSAKSPREPDTTTADTTTAPPVDENKELPSAEEPLKAFTGYSMDGKLISVSGRVQHLFPSDGGHITVENISIVEGSSQMKVAVKKDGHHFYTHINHVVVDPIKAPPQSQDNKTSVPQEKCEELEEVKRVKHGSLSAVLHNRIQLSYSFYGPMGECTDQELAASKTQTSPPQTSSPDAQGCEDQQVLPLNRFGGLNMSVPNGLMLQFLPANTQGQTAEERGVLVRQSFPLHGRDTVRHKSFFEEMSRIITNQGAVIRSMRDGSTEVLFANGSVSFSQDCGPVWVPDSEVQGEIACQNAEESKKGESSEKGTQRGCWHTTTPSGDRICTIGTTHKCIPTTSLLIYKATDPITHQVMLTREDQVVSVQNPDGSLIVEHADGTRITTLFQDRPLNATPHCLKHTGEQPKSTSLKSSSNENMPTQDTVESDKGSTKERVVLIEKEGYATIVMHPERHMAHVSLADGTVVTGSSQGEYEVFPSGVGLLHIQSDGKCVYSSDPQSKGSMSTIRPGVYTMSHTDKVVCDIMDPDGNHFQVMEDGQISVLNLSPAPSTIKNEEELPEEDREMSSVHIKCGEHCPRLFLVHEDGSGTELLSSETVEELFNHMYTDPTIALLKEPLPDTQDEFSITVLKPSHQSVWSQWLLNKQSADITPPNLRNRKWHDFPRVEKKTPGPQFGTNIGQGLTLRVKPGDSAPQHQPIRSCPKVLEMREIHQHRPFTTSLKNTIDSWLKEYIENLMAREQQWEEMKVKDPRNEEEISHASDLLSQILSFAEEDDASHIDRRISVDVASLYSQGVAARDEQSDVSDDTTSTDGESLEMLKWHSLQQQAVRNMRSLSVDLPPIPKSDSMEDSLKDAPQENTPRPLNPTPSQSVSHSPRSSRVPEKRPTNPTPQTAGESSWRSSSKPCKSLLVDVTGQPRRAKVRLPTSILSSKPHSVPNQRFLRVVEPVRRMCRTVSLADPSAVVRGFELLPSRVDFGTLREGTTSTVTVVMKNVGVDTCRFHVKQPRPATGLRVIYIPAPVPAGLQTELQVQLFAMCTVQSGEVEPHKHLSHDLIINTETDILYLPVTANIL
ncbi:sperm-associated antigen 17 [Pholidichthys leucotaenia]